MFKINLIHLAKIVEEGMKPHELIEFLHLAGYTVNQTLTILEKEKWECEMMINKLNAIDNDLDDYMSEKVEYTRGEYSATSFACRTLINVLKNGDTRKSPVMKLGKGDINQMFKEIVEEKRHLKQAVAELDEIASILNE